MNKPPWGKNKRPKCKNLKAWYLGSSKVLLKTQPQKQKMIRFKRRNRVKMKRKFSSGFCVAFKGEPQNWISNFSPNKGVKLGGVFTVFKNPGDRVFWKRYKKGVEIFGRPFYGGEKTGNFSLDCEFHGIPKKITPRGETNTSHFGRTPRRAGIDWISTPITPDGMGERFLKDPEDMFFNFSWFRGKIGDKSLPLPVLPKIKEKWKFFKKDGEMGQPLIVG